MGRKRKEINSLEIYNMAAKGMTQKAIAEKLGVSHVTLARRIAEIHAETGILLKRMSLEALQQTYLRMKSLEAIKPEKLAKASLRDLVTIYKHLNTENLI